ncbi:MAG: pyrroline-5-carboxylate reductase [Oscillospiraceae bacterium]|nr:pyrroline-5-carboxylate reductase [Oscillospiraceae bacterium]
MKYAFIGAGNMGGAILRAATREFGAGNFVVYERDAKLSNRLASEVWTHMATSEADAADSAQTIFLCVKPQYCAEPLQRLAPVLKGTDKTLVSIMAGVTLAELRERLDGFSRIVRVMPNMPALSGKGLMAVANDTECPEDVTAVLETCGEVVSIPEHLMNAETVAAACSPAYVFMFIEAMADAGVYVGLSRADATKFAAAALSGAAAMVLDGGEPAKLKDAICSPGGSTIRGVAELENSGFRGAVMRAFKASFDSFT